MLYSAIALITFVSMTKLLENCLDPKTIMLARSSHYLVIKMHAD